MDKETILTGLRTNAEYHLGNYLGAILPMVELQKNNIENFNIHMFAPDLHSFTTPIDHSRLYQQTLDNMKIFIAAGMPIDHDNFKLYRQSHIPAHSELTVILNNFAYFGELSRMTQFKTISDKIKNRGLTAGFFDYPVLMASDILLYGAKWVPVGEDQQQHLEFARNLALRFNNKFGNIFVVPEELKKQIQFSSQLAGSRIRSLSHPDKKMSKSIDDPAGTVLLSDTPKEATKKIMSATTDSLSSINLDWDKQPGISNLLQISSLLSLKSLEDTTKKWLGKTNYSELKTEVAAQVSDFLLSLKSNLERVDNSSLVEAIKRSEKEVSIIANKTLSKVQEAVGLRTSK